MFKAQIETADTLVACAEESNWCRFSSRFEVASLPGRMTLVSFQQIFMLL